MRLHNIILVCTSLLFTACRYPVVILDPSGQQVHTVVRVESDGDWEGTIGSQYIVGFGDRSYPARPGTCWQLRKMRSPGLLRTFATYSNYFRGNNGAIPVWSDRAVTGLWQTIQGCV
jgi:hypothetical protein